MSTGLECAYVEAQPNQWYLLLATTKDGWDWRESCNCFGPFPTEDEAQDFRRQNFANPGGYTSYPVAVRGDRELGQSTMDAIARAQDPEKWTDRSYRPGPDYSVLLSRR